MNEKEEAEMTTSTRCNWLICKLQWVKTTSKQFTGLFWHIWTWFTETYLHTRVWWSLCLVHAIPGIYRNRRSEPQISNWCLGVGNSPKLVHHLQPTVLELNCLSFTLHITMCGPNYSQALVATVAARCVRLSDSWHATVADSHRQDQNEVELNVHLFFYDVC